MLVRTETESSGSLTEVGERIRKHRQLRRLPLREVAERAGTSVSFLSQLERGKTSASFTSLRRIATALGVSLPDLFEERPVGALHVLRKGDRPALASHDGTRKYLLTNHPLGYLEAYAGEFDPGASTGPEQYNHGSSHELFIVLQGTVRVDIDQASFEMSAGDSIEYNSAQMHRTENVGNGIAKVLWVVSPPSNDLESSNGGPETSA